MNAALLKLARLGTPGVLYRGVPSGALPQLLTRKRLTHSPRVATQEVKRRSRVVITAGTAAPETLLFGITFPRTQPDRPRVAT
mmetsp:Transcript_45574/g.119714  ORF Transcript_45574/g.119714 Transcript_45574/m.119714 type:complete len:83 (-) Transcript_45574:2041-2289(-)